ncbi:MAG: NifB/NifX family molybdenum-iron cluster-binding protein [Candidatus Altiarchaeota archaeon]|nr:NifB/NifX family molybdenum-iron cluster-binding protein [Candidatus Altiarchaeota archaeon]
MKIAVPSAGKGGLDDMVGEHFGRVSTYTIIDSESGTVRVIENTSHHMGGQGYPPEILADAGVEVMLCQGLGMRAIQMFTEKGIQVYIDAQGKVSDALQKWKEGALACAGGESACMKRVFKDFHDKGE